MPLLPATKQPRDWATEGDHVIRIGRVDVFVDDQERARDFYTGMLGLEVKDDVPYGSGARWFRWCPRRTVTALNCC